MIEIDNDILEFLDRHCLHGWPTVRICDSEFNTYTIAELIQLYKNENDE